MGKLTGRAALVTGASRGLGVAIAQALLQEGANVLLCARSHEVIDVAEHLQERFRDQTVEGFRQTDVSRPGDVAEIFHDVQSLFKRLDILVCNAGIYGPIGKLEEIDPVDWIAAIQTNLIGTMLCCRAAIPLMRRQDYGKIIIISGGGATRPLPRFSAYAASKAAVVRFAETLAVELKGSGIDVNSIAPGALNTRMLDEVLEAGPQRAGQSFYDKAVEQKATGGTPLSVAAELVAFLASAECDGITGRLISAVWDNWRGLPHEYLQHNNPDRYTLRRIS